MEQAFPRAPADPAPGSGAPSGRNRDAPADGVVHLIPAQAKSPAGGASDRRRVRRSEPLALALQRLSLEQLEIAHDALAAPADAADWDRGVHEARKALKRTRALLRLIRDDLGRSTYRDENVVLRDQARYLSGVRSARVVVDTLDALVADDPGAASPVVVHALRTELLRRHADQAAAIRGDDDHLAAVKTALGCARNRYAAWPVLDIQVEADEMLIRDRLADGFGSIEPGIRRVYRRGRRAMRRAADERTAVAFHEWRKRVKYLRYQIEALRGCWTEVMDGLETSVDELGDILGDEHDLADLARIVAGEPALIPSPLHRTQLLAAIDRRRRRLQGRALRLGQKIYTETPTQFAARLHAYWDAWRPLLT